MSDMRLERRSSHTWAFTLGRTDARCWTPGAWHNKKLSFPYYCQHDRRHESVRWRMSERVTWWRAVSWAWLFELDWLQRFTTTGT